MRYLILSDMHANWDAFETVLRRARRKRFEAVLVLGDLVGYGAAPNQVVEAVRQLGPRLFTVRGNHDKVVAGIDSGGNFNQTALTAAQWTTGRLTPANLRYVRELPQGPLRVEEGLAICHGSPLDEDTYVFSDVDAWEIFSRFDMPVTFFGHTHIPSLFWLEGRLLGVRGAARHLGAHRALPRRPLPDQPRLDRPAPRPRSPRRLHDLRQRAAGGALVPHPLSHRRGPARASARPACRTAWRTGWRSGA